MSSLFLTLILISLFCHAEPTADTKSHLVKITSTIMIENDGNTPITHHLIDCDERNGHSRLSHIVAKMSNLPMPVVKTADGKMWRIDLSSKPIEPGVTTPLMVTKVYSHLELIPDYDVYLMPYSSIQYQVRIIKQGRPQKIKIPSEQYYLVVDDRDLVDLEESTSTVLALESEGSTKIRFVDKSVISDEDFIQPEFNIHIVKPSYMTMHISPGNSWALQKFTDYTIEIHIFDENQHQLYPSENLDIQLSTSNELIVTNSTVNGTHHTIHTLRSGPAKLTARLLGTTPTLYSFERPVQEIEFVQEMNIYEPLEIKPTAIVLPWLSAIKPTYQVSIYAAGATGSYRWATNNSVLTEISYGGDDSSVAKITTTGKGVAFVQCTDSKSSVFHKHSMIVVSDIVELSILPSITETELGGDILLPVAVYANASSLLGLHLPNEEVDSDLVLFHDCSQIKFDVDIVEKARFTHDASENLPYTRPKSCMSLKFTCLQAGSSRIWISYTDPTDPLSKPIKTTTIIACYKPLRPVYPEEVGVLALHTSIDLAFEGGPRPLGSRLNDHFSYLEPNNDPIISLEPIIDRYRFNKDLHVFRAHCNQYGEVALTLNVGNQPSATLPNPASSKTSIKVICAKPDSIQLRPKLKEACPLNELALLTDTIVPISTNLPTDFELVVFDDLKRPFLNISSFSIKWTMTGQGTSGAKLIEEVNAVSGFRRLTRNYITVAPAGSEGHGRLQAYLNQYKSQGLYRQEQTLDLQANLDIQFVDYAQIMPNKTIIYNHRKNVVTLPIVRGSGYFSVEPLQETKHANVTYVSVFGQHRVSVTPLSVGRFSVRLEDRCIESNLDAPILSEVSVVGDTDFSREALRPGRKLHYCQDIDVQIFCVYLSVEKVRSSTTKSPAPAVNSVAPPPPPPPTIPSQQPVTVAPTSPKAAVVQPITFHSDIPTRPTAASAEPIIALNTQESSVALRLTGFIIMFMITLSSLILGYKWWQDKNRPRAETSFIVRSPARGLSSSGSIVRSSTPRPLFSERFSTTITSD